MIVGCHWQNKSSTGVIEFIVFHLYFMDDRIYVSYDSITFCKMKLNFWRMKITSGKFDLVYWYSSYFIIKKWENQVSSGDAVGHILYVLKKQTILSLFSQSH